MNSLWDIRIFLGLVPKESPCITDIFFFMYHVLHYHVALTRRTKGTNLEIFLSELGKLWRGKYAHCSDFGGPALGQVLHQRPLTTKSPTSPCGTCDGRSEDRYGIPQDFGFPPQGSFHNLFTFVLISMTLQSEGKGGKHCEHSNEMLFQSSVQGNNSICWDFVDVKKPAVSLLKSKTDQNNFVLVGGLKPV